MDKAGGKEKNGSWASGDRGRAEDPQPDLREVCAGVGHWAPGQPRKERGGQSGQGGQDRRPLLPGGLLRGDPLRAPLWGQSSQKDKNTGQIWRAVRSGLRSAARSLEQVP